MALASARHILVEDEALCEDLKQQIADGSDFADIAKEHSKCPSGQDGGSLGEFGPGQMVPEFDQVIFSGELGRVHGPVKTQFGFHLIEITSRNDEQSKSCPLGHKCALNASSCPQCGHQFV